MFKTKKIKLVKLLTNDGQVIDKIGHVDIESGVKDQDGNSYPAGFDETGTVHGTCGDLTTGQILYEDGTDTGYNINQDYFSMVCMRVAYKNILNKKTA